MTKQVMPMSLVIIRPQIEYHLTQIANLLPEAYKLTFVARTYKAAQEVVLTQDNLTEVGNLLLEHGKEE